MAASFSVNTLRVDFESGLAMEQSGMVIMLKTLENTGLIGFLNATGSVYEAVVGEFFDNAKVISRTISGPIPAGGEGVSTAGGPKINIDTSPGEAFFATGPEGEERTICEQDEQMGGDNQNDDSMKRIRGVTPKRTTEATQFLPKIDPAAKGKGMLEVVARPNPVEERCQLVLNIAWEAVSNIMADFDGWIHFLTAVKLHDFSFFEDLIKIKDQFLLLDETEQVEELLQRRSLLMCKLYELEVQKLFDEHLENFKIYVPSVNHDYLFIRFLNKDLKEIARQHRDQRVLTGLPIVAPEASFVGATSNQSQTLAFEFSSQADQDQAQAQESDQRQEKIDEVVRGVVNIKETSDETGEHQAPNNKHQAHDEQVGVTECSLGGQQQKPSSGESPTQFEDLSVNNEDHVNLGTNPISEENNMDHQGPNPFNLQMVVYTGDSEENTHISFLEDSDSSHSGSQQIFISSPPASPHTGSKFKEGATGNVARGEGPTLYFGPKDLLGDVETHNAALVTRAMIANYEITCIFVDSGSSAFLRTSKGNASAISFGIGESKKTKIIEFMGLNIPSSARPGIASFIVLASSIHHNIKYPMGNTVEEVSGDIRISQKCYVEEVKVEQKSREESKEVFFTAPGGIENLARRHKLSPSKISCGLFSLTPPLHVLAK
ncbi:hypothetical protein F511_24038 [Dorcoceras hygrometricum]|uniref:Uncharacterized protein n=1 Tax=Dorcoceras hygrometricum TaxID=472368 RepID=A0A2Z7A6Y8_9LAMI|nr:hypothetical protein F511_24038 [Dorcoceras hygrometricum]